MTMEITPFNSYYYVHMIEMQTVTQELKNNFDKQTFTPINNNFKILHMISKSISLSDNVHVVCNHFICRD